MVNTAAGLIMPQGDLGCRRPAKAHFHLGLIYLQTNYQSFAGKSFRKQQQHIHAPLVTPETLQYQLL